VSVTASFNNPALTPGAPMNVVGTPGNGEAILTFSPPANTGGSPIIKYTATCNPGGKSGTASASPVTVSGLTNGTTYTCSVTATNSSATGLSSGTVSVTPPGPPALLGVVSRKTLGATQYELPIDLTKTINQAITVEPRIDTSHHIVFKFSVPVTSTGTVSVTDVNNVPLNKTVTVLGSEITITSSDVIGRRAHITLTGVNGV